MSNDQVWYREYAKTPYKRVGLMIKASRLERIEKSKACSGYCSVYWFSEEDAKKIRESGSSAGMDYYKVASDSIPIDLDEGDKQLAEIESILKKEGLAYEVYSSGGKGYHIFIPTDLMYDHDLPYSHLQFLKSIGIQADESLYQHGRLLSNVGRIHPKTGKKKAFVKRQEGRKAEVVIIKKPKFVYSGGDDVTLGLAEAMMTLSDLSINEPSPGNRHTTIWACAKDLVRCGLRDDTILDLLQNINSKWENPKTESELRLAINQARKQA